MKRPTRRAFLGRMGAVIGLATAPAARAAASPPRGRTWPVRLGGPVSVASPDPDELARAHRAAGYRAAYCPNVPLDDAGRLAAVEAAFARHDVVLAEVGRWVNLLDRDPARRAANLKTVTEGLALADAVGARCCVDIAGSFSTDDWYGPHPDNLTRTFFDAAVENARKIIDAVKPRRARFAYEMMGWAIPDSPDSCRKLVRAVDRAGFGVHLDPCNLVNSPTRFYRNGALITECFGTLGRWIVSCHAKDLRWNVEMNLHFVEVRPGLGALDYPTYLRGVAQLPQRPPLMLEHLSTPAEYDAARRHLQDLSTRVGVPLA